MLYLSFLTSSEMPTTHALPLTPPTPHANRNNL